MDSMQDEADGGGHASTSAAALSAAKKRKRNRQAVSCTNCKQRKIKCSRQIPCEACLKRGVANECKWAEAAVVPPPQVFALDAVVDAIRENFEDRIRKLEGLANVHGATPSAVVAEQARQDSYSAARQAAAAEADESRETSPVNIYDGVLVEKDEAETAAVALEVLAGGNETNAALEVKSAPVHDNRPAQHFITESLVWREFRSQFETNTNTPILAFLSRRTVVEAFLGLLKSHDMTKRLLDAYWENSGWILGCVIPERFMLEHQIFWNLVAAGERDFDPAYIAMLSALIAHALAVLPEMESSINSEEVYDVSRLAMEIYNWRARPSFRLVCALFFSSQYMSANGNLSTGYIYLGESIKAAQALSIHALGEDPATMPPLDRALPAGSLFAREMCVRLWWDLVTQDWIGATVTGWYSISASQTNTAKPRNFSNDQLLFGPWNEQPKPEGEFTMSHFYGGKAKTSEFCRMMVDLGPIPASGPELEKYYSRVLELDKSFVAMNKWFMGDRSSLPPEWRNDWRLLLGASGAHTRRLRLHRPLMTRAYRDRRFEFSARVCVESSQAVLSNIARLATSNMQTPAIWFLRRHAMSAIVALYIDVLHDVDVGVDADVSDRKLADIPGVLSIFKVSEKSQYERIRETGRSARLLVEALEDAKCARRLAKKHGGTAAEDYGQLLKRIASDVKTTTRSSSGNSNSGTPSSAGTTWLEDDSTRQLLSSLGLLDNSSGQWQPNFMLENTVMPPDWNANVNPMDLMLNGGQPSYGPSMGPGIELYNMNFRL